jgi:SAM-dependent methyltransferase
MAELLRDAFGAQAAMVLYTAAKLDLAEHLASGPRTAEQLATALGADARALGRILRALVSQGACEELTDSQFILTDLGNSLRAGHPHSIRARVMLNVEVHHRLWASMLDTAKSGESASVRVYGLPFYEYLASNREAGDVFDTAMSSAGWALQRFRAAVEAYDFGRFDEIVDVGGGNGAFLVEILASVPRPHGIVFDVDRVGTSAMEVISSRGLASRCRFVAGDAFAAVPEAADAYVLSNFLNSWGDAEAARVLRNCHRAMKPDATLLIVDWIMPTADQREGVASSRDATTMDLVMLCAFGGDSGRIRTFSEFCKLLADSGFDVTARMPARGSLEIIEARKSPSRE